MVLGAYHQSLTWLYFGRVVTGCAYAYQYSCDNGCLHLIPKCDRLEALFITLMARAVGFALGPCIAPMSDTIILHHPSLKDLFPTYDAAAKAVPLAIIVIFGVIFFFATIFFLNDFEELDAATEGVTEASASDSDGETATWEEKLRTVRVFSAVNFSNFTRIFIRVAWEAGAMMVLAHEYCIATVAG